jgi:ribose transport system ATP-binding protein
MTLALAFRDVVKRFGPVEVLHGVSFELPPGTHHRPARRERSGQVDADEDRLGYEAPTEGGVELNGRAARLVGPRAAEAEGIVLIHQEFNLAEDLTVAQNIFLGHERRRGLAARRQRRCAPARPRCCVRSGSRSTPRRRCGA